MRRTLTNALCGIALLAAPPAFGDIEATTQGIDRAFTIQYVCVQDFHQCVSGIGQDRIFAAGAYAQAYGDCCATLNYCQDLASHAESLALRSGHRRRGLFLADLDVLQCGPDRDGIAEQRRGKRMEAWRAERGLVSPDEDDGGDDEGDGD